MGNRPLVGFFVIIILIVGICGCVQQTSPHTNYKTGNSQVIGENTTSACPSCNGTGTVSCYNTSTGAATCGGTGIIQSGPKKGSVCTACGGTGVVICAKCNGTGRV